MRGDYWIYKRCLNVIRVNFQVFRQWVVFKWIFAYGIKNFWRPLSSLLDLKEKRQWNWLALDTKLNTNQREVIERILAPGNTSSPLVVFGPFGTGKTLTLNQAIRQLVTRKRNRILLCTHTNSAADLHVKLLHDYLTDEDGLEATKPLRIYQTDRRSVNLESLWANQAGFRKRH